MPLVQEIDHMVLTNSLESLRILILQKLLVSILFPTLIIRYINNYMRF